MSRMWEVDPETKTKLLAISKTNGNDRCCDCGAPSPQWASPKFGTFICLNCAGTHRGLGVHISFVRSITMDAFKHAEILRMEQGGNEPWKAFFDNHPATLSEGRTFDDSTIRERYDGDVGEEWKDRLTAKVEQKEYVPGQTTRPKKQSAADQQVVSWQGSRSSTPLATAAAGTPPRRGSPAASVRDKLAESGGGDGGKKARNEAYFARLGSENASRPENLPPSHGGKYTGFGGGLPPTTSAAGGRGSSGSGGVPGLEDLQKDPVAALSKGFGWFATAVGRGAKTVNDRYIQPTAKTIAESDFAAQARVQASQIGQNLHSGARGAAESFNRFVEGPDDSQRAGTRRRQEPDEHKDFWDNNMSSSNSSNSNSNFVSTPSSASAIGTAAMKTKPAASPGPGAAAGGPASASSTTAIKGKDDSGGWDDNW